MHHQFSVWTNLILYKAFIVTVGIQVLVIQVNWEIDIDDVQGYWNEFN